MKGIVLALLVVAGCTAPSPPMARKHGAAAVRIVSTNPCTDAILVELVAKDRISAISHYSLKPESTSTTLEKVAGIKAIGDTAEETVALRPDLVLAASHMSAATRAAIAASGAEVLTLGVPANIDESLAQIREVAKAVGETQRGEALVARIEGARTAAMASRAEPLPALIWQGSGLVPGQGTLADEMLGVAGFRNANSLYGLQAWDILPLEKLAMNPPEVVFTPLGAEGDEGDARSRAVRERLFGRMGGKAHIVDFAPRLLYCGGPTIVDALGELARVRKGM